MSMHKKFTKLAFELKFESNLVNCSLRSVTTSRNDNRSWMEQMFNKLRAIECGKLMLISKCQIFQAERFERKRLKAFVSVASGLRPS
ncbi:hypothetical protein K0M31_002088 [Melipona bicolor]|uniref:Uncharacterized protein n=1 Tax=Melipona bicolor TaxID=60889 RepID=A0AA40KY74_9HYME|nr:hypothetical protein K0M31_002088 [Melipona bicolor]